MPGIHRQGDNTAGHGCWPPTVPAGYSPSVFVNGLAAVRNGDPIVPHTCPSIPETHGGNYAGGGTVYVNGRAVQVAGSPVSCGDSASGHSPNVTAGGAA